MRASLLALALLTLAACDSADPAATPTPPLRSFDLTGLPAQIELELTDADTIAVPGVFGAARDGLSFAITGTGGATVIGSADAFIVRAEALGESTVSIGISATGYRDTTATIAVRVVPGVCPPAGAAGTHDFFPVAGGEVWRFVRRQTTNGGQTYTEDPVTTTFADVRCLRGARTGVARYRLEPNGPTEARPFSENARNEVRFATPEFGIESKTYVFSRYATGDSALILPVGGSCGPSDGEAQFKSGNGLTLEDYACGGIGGFVRRALTRQP